VTAGLGLVKMSENAGFKFYDEADLFIFTLQTDLYEPEMLCRSGDPREVIATVAPCKYSREDLARYVTIEGTMVGWLRQDFQDL
jgi:hypothetical protein